MRTALLLAGAFALAALVAVLAARSRLGGEELWPATFAPAPVHPPGAWEGAVPLPAPAAIEPADGAPAEPAPELLAEAPADIDHLGSAGPDVPAPPPAVPAGDAPRDEIEIRGQVVDRETHRPIAGAEVFLNGAVRLWGEPRRTITDEQGCFSLGNAHWRETGTVSVRAPGYRWSTWFSPIFSEDFGFSFPRDWLPRVACGLRFALEPRAARVLGKVVDEAGAAVAEGYVMAYDPSEIAYLDLDRGWDVFSRTSFFSEAPNTELPHFGSGVFSVPFAALDEQGAFEITCLPHDRPLGLLVLAPDVKRAIWATISPGEGEAVERDLVVERWLAIPGTLVAPGGAEPSSFGIWVCPHDGCACLADERVLGSSDLWVPVQLDGSFVAGPLAPERTACLRVSRRAMPDPRLSSPEYFSQVRMLLDPAAAAGRLLEVDLRRPEHFALVEQR